MCYMDGNFVKSGIGQDLYKQKKRTGGVYDKKQEKTGFGILKRRFAGLLYKTIIYVI